MTSILGLMVERTARNFAVAARRVLGRLGRAVRATSEQAAIGQSVGHAGMYGSVPPSIGGAMMVAAGQRIGAEASAGAVGGPSRRSVTVAAGVVLVIVAGLVAADLTGRQPSPSTRQLALARAVADAPSAGWSYLTLNAPELQAATRICAFAPGTSSAPIEAALGFRWDDAANAAVVLPSDEDLVVAATRESVVAWARVPKGSGTRLIVSASGCDERR